MVDLAGRSVSCRCADDYLLWMAWLGPGGPVAGGARYVSWIHDRDFVRAVEFLVERDDISGAVNLAAPGPLPQGECMCALRAAWRMPVGLPATRWMAELGALVRPRAATSPRSPGPTGRQEP